MIKLTPEIAEIIGIHAGDGYLRFRTRNKGEIDISGNVEEKPYYDNHVIPIFNKAFKTKIKGRYFSRGTYGFVTYNKKIRDYLFSVGFPSGKKSHVVKVPQIILKSKNKKIYSMFLRGLFDTDGCLSFDKRYSKKYKKFINCYPRIIITTTSKELCRGASMLLKRLSIEHFSFGYQPTNLKYHYKYTIIINGSNRLKKWMKLVGMKNNSKLSKYIIWKTFGFCPPRKTLKEREDILKGRKS